MEPSRGRWLVGRMRFDTDRWSEAVATVLYLGYCPAVPGTAGSVPALVLFRIFHDHTVVWTALAVALFALGTSAAKSVAAKMEHSDPRCVVVDELVGMMATLTALEWSWTTVLGAFVAFRFFDVVKPFPARLLEHVPNGFGIMLDDIVAAVYANVAIRLAFVLIPR